MYGIDRLDIMMKNDDVVLLFLESKQTGFGGIPRT